MGRAGAKLLVVTAVLVALGLRETAVLVAPDHSHLPEALRPHRPLPVVLINFAGDAIRRAGYGHRLGMLTSPDALLEAVCSGAELRKGATCDLDMDAALVGRLPRHAEVDADAGGWREGLAQLLESAKAARLSALGELVVVGQAKQWLVTRARLLHAYRQLPEGALAAEAIERPIVIAGLFRTGTTFLENLMAQDPRLRAPVHWELVEPIPASGTGQAPGDSAHLAAVQRKLDQYTALLPAFDDVHPMEATMAEECVVTLAHEFVSLLFGATYDVVDTHVRWALDRGSHGRALRWHRRLLQFLQLRGRDTTPWARKLPPRRWLLKTPYFLGLLDDLAREYPDLTVIHTHRDPAEAVGSSASVHARTYGVVSDDIDLHRIGRQQKALAEDLVARAAASRERLSEQGVRIVDVKLVDMKRDPLAAVAQVYEKIGLDFPADVRLKMQAWLKKRQVRHGGHKYALADFGLDAAEMVASSEVFSDYCAEHGLAGPGCDGGGSGAPPGGEVEGRACAADTCLPTE